MKFFLLSFSCIFFLAVHSFGQIRVNDDGKVIVGSTLAPSQELHVVGDVYVQNGKL